jgi:predicted permease
MEETFALRLADAKSTGARVRVLLRESWSVVVLGVGERRRGVGVPMQATTGAGWMEQVMRETRHAARRLGRSPAFTFAAAATLALAIGANASIFTVVYRVVLNPLPYANANRLIALDHGAPGVNAASGLGMSTGLYYHYLDRARTLDGVALYWSEELTLTGVGDPERIRVANATPSLSPVLGVAPLLGRWFTEEEGEAGTPPVLVVSHAFWTRRFGRDPGVVGQSMTLSGRPYQVVGVMPAGFRFPDPRVRLWRSAQIDRETARAGGFNFLGVGRLRDGASLDVARAELNGLIADLPNAYPNDPFAPAIVNSAKLTSTVLTMKERLVGRTAGSLWIVLASVGLVLLVACANVANLFLVRSEARQREIAVRSALGAGRAGIARFFLTESVLLATLGGVLGLGITAVGVRLLVAFGPPNLPRLEEVRIDAIVVLFALALGLFSALAFGSIPLMRRRALAPALHESGRGNTASRGRHRTRHLLMGGQVALACVLLVGAGLMVRSFQNLRAVDPQFDAASVLTFRIGLPAAEYPTREAAIAVHYRILDGLAALPGVSAASASTCLPLAEEGFCHGDPLNVDGRAPVPGTVPPVVAFRGVAGEYFETMGMPAVRGRTINRADVQANNAVAVINEAMVDVYFPGEDPIGRRVTMDFTPNEETFWFTIVGVVRTTPTFSLADATPTPKIYMAWQANRDIGPGLATMTFVVRSSTPALNLQPAVRRTIAGVDPNLALAQVRTLEDILDRASAHAAFTMALLVLAAAVALLLGLIGIYGVISYIVTQRAGEIGVRLALGAEPKRVAGMILRQGGAVTGAGLLIGLVAAAAGGRMLRAILFEVSPTDPLTYAAAAASLLSVALFACWLPARRAARLSPLEALRIE